MTKSAGVSLERRAYVLNAEANELIALFIALTENREEQ